MIIGFANDHTGVDLKKILLKHCEEEGYTCIDLGTNTPESVDYPDYAHSLADAIRTGKADCGFAFCGTGNGIAMTLNKHPHIRAGLAWNAAVARLIKQHNDVNVCVIPARFVIASEALSIADAYLDAVFEGGRHQKRIDKMIIHS